MAKVTELTAKLAEPLVQQQGCTLWDVEYVKEAGTWYLRVLLDKEEGVSIDDCEAVSRALSDQLDELDPIEGSYVLEVGSAGLERTLKKPDHFAHCMGQQVEVRLYRAIDGKKMYVGTLTGYENGAVSLDDGPTFEKKDVAQVRLHVTF